MEQLLRSVSVHRQSKTPLYHQNHSGRGTLYRNHQDGRDIKQQRGQLGFSTNHTVKDLGYKDVPHRRLQQQNNHHHFHHDRHQDGQNDEGSHHWGSYHLTNRVNDIHRNSGETNFGRANGYPTPKLEDPKVVHPCHTELRYTPQNDIPLRDYITVDDKELYCSNSPSAHSYEGIPATALYSSATLRHRVPSPLFGDDVPYTILNSVNTTEPITAIFMGFQTAQDDSGQVQEDFQGSLRAELVVIDEDDRNGQSCPNGDVGQVAGDRWTGRGMASGMRKMKRKHRACCTVC